MRSMASSLQNNTKSRQLSSSPTRLDSNGRPTSSATPDDIFSKHHRDIALPDGPIRVYEYGPQNGQNDTRPPIILLHGAMLDTAPFTWRHLLPSLSVNRRVLAIDMPRHGASRPWPSSTTLDQAAFESMLTSLLDNLSLDKANLIGLSMGGGVATGYALSNPSRVNAFVAINPGGLDASRPWQLATYLTTRCPPLLNYGTRYLATSPDVLRSSMVTNLTAGAETRDFDALMALAVAEAKERARHGEAALDDWQIAAYGAFAMKVNFTPLLEKLSVPSLWVHGAEDKLVTEDVMRKAAGMAPGGRFVNIPKAAHIASLDQPEVVHDAIVEFLDEMDG